MPSAWRATSPSRTTTFDSARGDTCQTWPVGSDEPEQIRQVTEPAAHDADADPGQPGIPVEWLLDTALGAASTASRVAGVVGRSLPGRAATSAARLLTRPLSREGHEVRGRIGTEAVPAAKEVLQQVTPEVVEAVGINEVLEAIDVDALLDRIDVNRLVERIDVAAVVAQVDVEDLVATVDVDGLVARVDVDDIVRRVDVDEIVRRVDVDRIVGAIDLDRLLASIDLDALLARIDLNSLVERIDVDQLVQNTELGSIIARSTTGVASEALDAVRRQGVSLDNIVARVANRLLRRDLTALPAGPPLLVDPPRALPAGPTS